MSNERLILLGVSCIHVLKGRQSHRVRLLAFWADGRRFASLSRCNVSTMNIWDPTTGSFLHVIRADTPICHLPFDPTNDHHLIGNIRDHI
jgi:hypothetical protein